MNKILIIAEHHAGQLNSATARCVTCAQTIGGSVDVLVLAATPEPIVRAAAGLQGVSRVLSAAHEANLHALAATYAPQIAALAPGYTHLLAPSTTFGKDLMPRVAALLGVAQVSDLMQVEGPRTFVRPIYAGNVLVTVEVPEGHVVAATVRPASWPEAAVSSALAPIEAVETHVALPTHTRFVALEGASSERPDLQSAQRVVSGGRALGSGENFKLIYELADRLGAAVGASRAAVDAGYVPSDMQVGQTGKIIAPQLYIAVGISGAIQHLTGIKDAGTIVAINKDAEAPIFDVADYGLVGDLFRLVPELVQALN